MSRAELHLRREARPEEAYTMRHALDAFLSARGVAKKTRLDVITAVGEAIANAIEHAYRDGALGEMEVRARISEARRTISVEVRDFGSFVQRRRRPNRGFGLPIIRAAARSVSIDTDSGTTVRLEFDV